MAPPTLQDFVSGPWKTACYGRCKPSTCRRMDSVLRTQLLPSFGAAPLDRIARPALQEWFDRYSRVAPAGANRALDVLRQILSHAVACGVLIRNPTRGMKHNPRPARTRFLSQHEITRLHEALDDHRGRGSGRQQVEIIRLLLLTGCRKGEITSLRWSQIDGDTLHLTDSKTGPRTVFLNAHAQAILSRQPRTESTHVFPSLTDSSRCRSSELSVWRKVRREAGIGDVRLHDLRHTFASYAVMQCVPLPVVSRLLGHRQARMTLRYAHVSDRETEAAAERIGAAIAALLADPGPPISESSSLDRCPKNHTSLHDDPGTIASVERHVPCYSRGTNITHVGSEASCQDEDRHGVFPRSAPGVRRVLSDLEAAARPEDLDLPGYGLQALADEREGRWSVRVSARQRLVFGFVEGTAVEPNLIDHHEEASDDGDA